MSTVEMTTPTPPADSPRHLIVSALPTWAMIRTKQLEIRKRLGLMVVVALLTFGLPFLVLGIRMLLHAVDATSYGPAGSPGVFSGLANAMAEFGFIVAATLGTAAGTTDLSDGVFRHLVVTGRSRVALYLARLPAGLSILLPLAALGFTILCLVTTYAGTPQVTATVVNGITIPSNLSEPQFETWVVQHPGQAIAAFANGLPAGASSPGSPPAAALRTELKNNIGAVYGAYTSVGPQSLNPAPNEMAKIGLWLELELGIGFVVGLGLGSLIGQRTVSTILMIGLEIIVTPILAHTVIPYFLNGQRLIVGVAMDQLRPAGLLPGVGGGARALGGGRGALSIPAMPTWAMITVIACWLVGWTAIGAWKMATRDA